MKEEFISFLWKFSYYNKASLNTTDGEPIKVINPGEENTDAGPDFFNSKIKIGDTTWVGNVEIHTKSSDWIKHNHQNDKAYDSVILHVVLNDDLSIRRESGEKIPTVILQYDFAFENKYLKLMKNKQWIACENYLQGINKFQVHFWLAKVGIERLHEKSESIYKILISNNYDWEEGLYISIAGSLGMKINTDPFIMLLKSIPHITLLKYKNNLFQLEAILFGQAGFLDDSLFGDEYFEKLKKEYNYLRKKHKLRPIMFYLWKFLRLRPSNFPGIRIAQLSVLIYTSSSLFSKIIGIDDLSSIKSLFNVKASEYWDTHYVFNKPSRKKIKQLGSNSIDLIIINTVIPYIFVFGNEKGLEHLKERAIRFLEEMKPEKNAIIKRWENYGIEIPNAFYSQALIYLKRNYCDKKECLKCKIGNEIITTEKIFQGSKV